MEFVDRFAARTTPGLTGHPAPAPRKNRLREEFIRADSPKMKNPRSPKAYEGQVKTYCDYDKPATVTPANRGAQGQQQQHIAITAAAARSELACPVTEFIEKPRQHTGERRRRQLIYFPMSITSDMAAWNNK
jgi:hypothetical protein